MELFSENLKDYRYELFGCCLGLKGIIIVYLVKIGKKKSNGLN